MINYIPLKLMHGKKPVMSIKEIIPTSKVLPMKDDLYRKELLTLWIQKMIRKPKYIKEAIENNKERFDKILS